jgi:putative ABC transport system substrate-binding protein
MIRRRDVLAVIGAAAFAPVPARADQDRQVPLVGVLTGNVSTDQGAQMRVQAFRQGLADLGWIDGQNVQMEVRWPGPNPARLEQEARQLVALSPDVILATSTRTTRALRDATHTIPIVFVGLSDPVATGIVSNLARPTANATGFSLYEHSMSGKWLSMLKDMAPHLAHVVVMYNPDTTPYAQFYLHSAEQMSKRLALHVSSAAVRSTQEIEPVIAGIAAHHGGLVVLPDGGFFAANSEVLLSLAARYRVPAIYAVRFYAANGGLMSYGADLTSQFRDGASYVDRLLRGVTPRDLPVQFATKFELVINLKAAAALGLTVPNRLLLDAELIE